MRNKSSAVVLFVTLVTTLFPGCYIVSQVDATSDPALAQVVQETKSSTAVIHLRDGTSLHPDSVALCLDSLTVWQEGLAIGVPRNSLAGVTVRSTGAGIGSGALVGFMCGAAFGVGMGIVAGGDMESDGWEVDYVGLATVSGLCTGLVGALVGGIVGGIVGDGPVYEFTQPPDIAPELSGLPESVLSGEQSLGAATRLRASSSPSLSQRIQ